MTGSRLSIVILLLFTFGVFIGLYLNSNLGWGCTNQVCDYKIGGAYATKGECISECAKLLGKKDRDLDKWACVNNLCRPSESGYSSQAECIAECPNPFVSTFNPAMSDWGFAWSNRYRMPSWAKKEWTHNPSGGWTHV